MRTTLNLDDDVLQLIKAIAEVRGVSLGKAISDLARRGATTHPPLKEKNGFYLFPVTDTTKTFGPEQVATGLEVDDDSYGRFFLKQGS